MSYRVLLAEDEKDIRNITTKFLSQNDFEVDAVSNGLDAVDCVNKNSYDAIVLDIMMPGMDGKEVCRHIRNHMDVPVIFLTALDKEEEIVEGYEYGADEYITKPFSMPVLLMKINALIKRYRGLLVKNGKIQIGELIIEPASHKVYDGGKEVILAPKEYDLLIYLIDNKNLVLTREQILDNVWGSEYEGYDRAVDTHIKKLRAALYESRDKISTIIKVGYSFKE